MPIGVPWFNPVVSNTVGEEDHNKAKFWPILGLGYPNTLAKGDCIQIHTGNVFFVPLKCQQAIFFFSMHTHTQLLIVWIMFGVQGEEKDTPQWVFTHHPAEQ